MSTRKKATDQPQEPAGGELRASAGSAFLEWLSESPYSTCTSDMQLALLDAWLDAIPVFVEVVERKAEDKMLLTGKLEGAHYAAMKQIAEKWRWPTSKPNDRTERPGQ